MQVIRHLSPNFNPRDGHVIDMLVLHYTGMKSGANALDRMCDATAEVSAHYMVEEDGRIFQLVDEEMRAWHAGKSYWRGHTNINQRSIGIEIVNPGHEFGYRAFPEVQMQSVIALCKEIVARHNIPARNVVGHSDVAPTRKEDPGELFDWARLAEEGIGLWPEANIPKRHLWLHFLTFLTPFGPMYYLRWNPGKTSRLLFGLPQYEIMQQLKLYGYDVTDSSKATIAFQRHFRPQKLSGKWDWQCANLLEELWNKALAT